MRMPIISLAALRLSVRHECGCYQKYSDKSVVYYFTSTFLVVPLLILTMLMP